jgi:SAM-dependent methyltransferase
MNPSTLRLPEWVVCPLCHGDLDSREPLLTIQRIACGSCGTDFPVDAGIPTLLDAAGRAEADVVAREGSVESYHAARHVSPCNIQYYDFWCGDLLARLPDRPFRRVVELMAGGAELSRRAHALPRPIVAIDLNRRLLQMSRDQLLPEVVPVCASAERLPFRDGAIDLVLIQGGLHHVRRRVEPVLREIGRCMAPGALLLASEPRNDNPLNRAVRRAFYHLHPIPDEDEEDGFTYAEMNSFLGAAGLALEQYDPFAYVGYVLVGNTDLVRVFARMERNWISSLLIGIDRAWGWVPVVRRLGWASQIRATKTAPAVPPPAYVGGLSGVSGAADLERRTIRDFGEQWTAYRDNNGFYGSPALFEDVFGPLLPELPIGGGTVADVGAGTGRFVRILLDAGADHVTAVEPSEAFAVLKANTSSLADRITYLNVPGDQLPATGNLDLVFSYGVLHHIPDPAPVLRAAVSALRPGGKCAVWLYGREGNRLYITVAGALWPLTRRLPHSALAWLSFLLDFPLVLYAALCRPLRFLPLAGYMREVIARLTPDKRRLVIYDQLNPAYAKYYSEAEARALLEDAGFNDVRLYHRHGYSWSVVGTRPGPAEQHRRA